MGTFIKASDLAQTPSKPHVIRPSGILPLDIAGGAGGWQSGAITEIFGEQSTGKTLLALIATIVAQQKYNERSLLIDGEFVWDPGNDQKFSWQVEWYRRLGGNPKMLDIYHPVYSEETYTDILKVVAEDQYAYIIVDSWRSMTPKLSLEKDITDKADSFGLAAKVNAGFLSQLMPILYRSKTHLLVINHLMEKIGVTFGNPESTPGGKLLKFYAKQRIRLSPTKAITNGVRVKGKFVKNKISAPFGVFEFNLDFAKGIDTAQILYDLGAQYDIYQRGGSKYTYRDTVVDGKDNFIQTIREDAILKAAMEADLKRVMKVEYEHEAEVAE